MQIPLHVGIVLVSGSDTVDIHTPVLLRSRKSIQNKESYIVQLAGCNKVK